MGVLLYISYSGPWVAACVKVAFPRQSSLSKVITAKLARGFSRTKLLLVPSTNCAQIDWVCVLARSEEMRVRK
jgi:hypothetical protein